MIAIAKPVTQKPTGDRNATGKLLSCAVPWSAARYPPAGTCCLSIPGRRGSGGCHPGHDRACVCSFCGLGEKGPC